MSAIDFKVGGSYTFNKYEDMTYWFTDCETGIFIPMTKHCYIGFGDECWKLINGICEPKKFQTYKCKHNGDIVLLMSPVRPILEFCTSEEDQAIMRSIRYLIINEFNGSSPSDNDMRILFDMFGSMFKYGCNGSHDRKKYIADTIRRYCSPYDGVKGYYTEHRVKGLTLLTLIFGSDIADYIMNSVEKGIFFDVTYNDEFNVRIKQDGESIYGVIGALREGHKISDIIEL